MSIRAIPGKLYMQEAVPFGQRYTYDSPHSIVDALSADYFGPVKSNLRVGDEIRICRVTEGRMREFQDAVVVQKLAHSIEVYAFGKRFIVPEAKTEAPPATETKPRVLHEVKRGYQCFQAVIAETGKVVSEHGTKAEAEAVVAELNGEKKAA